MGLRLVHDLRVDLRHAGRLLRRQLGFSAFAVLGLGAGVGAATSVFTLVRAVLLRELPFRSPDRLVWMYNRRTERDRAPLSIPDLQDYRRENRTLAGAAAFTNWTTNLTGAGTPERLEGTRVDGDFFRILGSSAAIGRALAPGDADDEARVVVLTHRLWQRRFGGDPGIVGRPLTLNEVDYRVVGVMPKGFVFPFRDAELAVPLTLRGDPRRGQRGANFLRVVARLRRGVSLDAARADLDAIARRLQRSFPDDDARKTGVSLYPLHAEIVGDYGRTLSTVFVAVGLLLSIGCGNLVNLMLVRAAGRRAELELRASLGASPGRIRRQLATEAAVIATAGGILGVGIAQGAVVLWRTLGPPDFPRMAEVAIDGRVLAFSCAVSAVVALVCGLAPAPSVSASLASGFQEGARSVTAGRHQGSLRRAFVGLQVAGSALLLVCTGLVFRGFARLEGVDPGFSRRAAATIQLSLPPRRYADREALIRFHDALARRLRELPGARAAGAVSLLPLTGLLSTVDYVVPDRPAPSPEDVPQAHFRAASEGYFDAAGIRLREGREFREDDGPLGAPVAVISRTLARRQWPEETAVGRHLRIADPPDSPLLEVVGVVDDVKQLRLDAASTADLYVPIRQVPASAVPALAARTYWVVAANGDARLSAAALQREVRAVDPDVAGSSVRTLEEIVTGSLGPRRLNVRLLEVFGFAALVLSAFGVYGTTAFSVGARRRDLALRAALGATPRALLGLVLRQELRPVLVGLAAGLAAGLFVARLLGDALFATSPSDPLVYLAVGTVLFTTAAVTCSLPARRGANVDPARLLRT